MNENYDNRTFGDGELRITMEFAEDLWGILSGMGPSGFRRFLYDTMKVNEARDARINKTVTETDSGPVINYSMELL